MVTKAIMNDFCTDCTQLYFFLNGFILDIIEPFANHTGKNPIPLVAAYYMKCKKLASDLKNCAKTR